MEIEQLREKFKEDSRVIFWSHSTGLNQMCYKCPLLFSKCIGSKARSRWQLCTKRGMYEREHREGER